jgi:hypothetical protein
LRFAAAVGRHASAADVYHVPQSWSAALQAPRQNLGISVGGRRWTVDGRRKTIYISAVKRMLGIGACIFLWACQLYAGLIPYTPNDRDFIRSGPRAGFYAISSDSGRWWDWGLVRAPVDEPTPFNHGNGTDAVAIPFDRNERVGFAPVYIYTIRPEKVQEQRLAAVVPGVSTTADVVRLYGRPAIKAQVRGCKVWYYEIRVFNPFAEYPGGDTRSR